MDRKPPEALEGMFRWAVNTPTDINEHLEILRDLASQCEHVTEFGMRTGMSTVAFLAAQPAQLISWDINPLAVVSQNAANLLAVAGRTRFQPRVGNTLEIITEPTDMLFIDSLHVGTHLKAELERHADPLEKRVRKFLAFHDVVTFGEVSEDGSRPGLRDVIEWFMRKHAFPIWEPIHNRMNNNGLVVLKHVGAK